MALEYFQWLQQADAAALADSRPLVRVLEFVDGLAAYYEQQGVPSAFVGSLLKICRLHSRETRLQAAAAVAWSSEALRGARALWGDLKPALRDVLEAAATSDLPVGSGLARTRAHTASL